MPTEPPAEAIQEQLSRLFGSYKAEWLRERLFDLFTEPQYFPELLTPRPCMLVGGRGTGKTTVLRCLSYEGQFALSGRQPERIASSPYYGFYYRVNTNRVTAFKGPELAQADWIRLFAHYFNLVLVDLVLRFLSWYELHTSIRLDIPQAPWERISASLHLGQASSLREIADQLDLALVKFEAYVNNVVDGNRPPLSMQGAPVDALLETLATLAPFNGKHFFFVLDEYENFEDYQQQVVNSLIKHSGALYTFKIGVRELGWRRRVTLNENEQLISPADYVRINIVEKLEGDKFRDFARQVCNARISRLDLPGEMIIQDIDKVLPGLSEDEEALKLGVSEDLQSLRRDPKVSASPQALSLIDSLPPLQIYFCRLWAEAESIPVVDVLTECAQNPGEWSTRYNNYKHAMLYTLKSHKRGIRKYYAGWSVFTYLAGSNIRYVLELSEQSLLLHLNDGGRLSEPVSPERQTRAAAWVGKKNLSELEGLSVHGAQLTKLLLGLGRVFQVMAEQPLGHAPEVNHFYLADDEKGLPSASDNREATDAREVENLLKAAVMHLALIRWPGNKLADEADTRDYDYMVHPVFCPFFVFSYRRKRKVHLSARQLLGLVKRPKETIRDVLTKNNRIVDEELPEQLLLFEAYYRGGS